MATPIIREIEVVLVLSKLMQQRQKLGCQFMQRVHAVMAAVLTGEKDERERREIRAKAVCQVCPVADECRDYAFAIKEPYGIWGGLTESERRHALSRR